MKLAEFDSDATDNSYYLRLEFQPLGWMDLMNEFQLPFSVYSVLFCAVGLAAVGTWLICWMVVRLSVKCAKIPYFRFLECYEFMLWWPAQGVIVASIPVIILLAIIKILFSPSFDLMRNIPCDWVDIGSSKVISCKNARTGSCFYIGGLMMLWSGSEMIIPKLRLVERDFLLSCTSAELDKEGFAKNEGDKGIEEMAIRWKRCHLIWSNLLLTIPLMIMWEFSYSDFFGDFTLEFIVSFMIMMMYLEGVLTQTVREVLLTVPMVTGCEVVLFIATMGADNFMDFTEGFFVELLIGIFDRLLLGSILDFVYGVNAQFKAWIRTRSWFWSLMIRLGQLLNKPMLGNFSKQEDDEEAEQEECEPTAVEEAMEEHISGGSSCMNMIISPFVIGAIWVFWDETKIPQMYDIRLDDLKYYLFFGIFVAPFQVMMDIFLNHSRELAHGIKIYDYMLFAKWRWRNRLTNWLFDDPRFDMSIPESVQSVNHLCFSPQYYFIAAYFSWGVILVLLGLCIILRAGRNPLGDPALPLFFVQQFVANRFLDKAIRALSLFLWRAKDNATARAFSHAIIRGQELKMHQVQLQRYRTYVFEKHKEWMMSNMHKVFEDPAVRERFRPELYALYSRLLNLKPPQAYKTPQREDQVAVDLTAGGQLIPAEGELDETDEPKVVKFPKPAPPPKMASLPWPLYQYALPANKAPDIFPLTRVSIVAWVMMARRRVRLIQLAHRWKEESTLADTCNVCGVEGACRDPQWEMGPQLRIFECHDIDVLINEFEKNYDLTQEQLAEKSWSSWLKRHYMWNTLCWRCARVLDLERTPTPSEQDPLETINPSEGITTVGVTTRSDLSDDSMFPEWMEVDISTVARDVLLKWARAARGNLQKGRISVSWPVYGGM